MDVCAIENGDTFEVANRLEVTEGSVTVEYERPALSAYFQQTCTNTIIQIYRPIPGQTGTCTGELLLETVPFIYRAATIELPY